MPFDHGFEPKKWARVHFIPDLKVGVFVTLRAPDVIKERIRHIERLHKELDNIIGPLYSKLGYQSKLPDQNYFNMAREEAESEPLELIHKGGFKPCLPKEALNHGLL